MAELNLADIFLAKGDLALAQEFLDGIYQLVEAPTTSEWMKWRYSTHLFMSLGELWLSRGKPSKAREVINQGLEIAVRTNSRKYVVRGQRLRGQIALKYHEHDEAERWLQQALPLAQTVGNPTQLWMTHLAWGQLHSGLGHRDRAQQAYQAARAVLDQIKTNVHNPNLRANLGLSPLMQRVYELGEQ